MSRMKKTAEKPVKESVAEPVVETAAAAKPAPKKPAPASLPRRRSACMCSSAAAIGLLPI